MELDLPNGTSADISESVGNWWTHKVPQLDASVASTRDQVWARRVEINCRDPVSVAFPSHDVFICFHIPNLPSAVVGGSCHNLLTLMEGHASDSSSVSLNLSIAIKSVGNRLVSLGQEGIRPGVLRHSRVSGNTLAESTLTIQSWLIGLSIATHLLALVLGLNFFLNPFLTGFYGILECFCLLLKFVFLELEKSLLFCSLE